jgi:hypothetical protein
MKDPRISKELSCTKTVEMNYKQAQSWLHLMLLTGRSEKHLEICQLPSFFHRVGERSRKKKSISLTSLEKPSKWGWP